MPLNNAAWDPAQQHYYTYGFHRNSIDCSWCNYYNGSSYCYGSTLPVGSFDGTGGKNDAHNYYGCYDMSGNLLEWTSEQDGSARVLRGGAWGSGASYCTTAYRGTANPSYRNDIAGFRLSLDLN